METQNKEAHGGEGLGEFPVRGRNCTSERLLKEKKGSQVLKKKKEMGSMAGGLVFIEF